MGWPTTGTAIGLKQLLDVKDQKMPIFPDSKIGSCGLPIPGANLKVFIPENIPQEGDIYKSPFYRLVNIALKVWLNVVLLVVKKKLVCCG